MLVQLQLAWEVYRATEYEHIQLALKYLLKTCAKAAYTEALDS